MSKLNPKEALWEAINICGGISELSDCSGVGRRTIYDALNKDGIKTYRTNFMRKRTAMKIERVTGVDWRLICTPYLDNSQIMMIKEIESFTNNPDKTKDYNLRELKKHKVLAIADQLPHNAPNMNNKIEEQQ